MRLIPLILLLVLGACSSTATDPLLPPPPTLPYRTWEIGLLAPSYMEAWVESVDVLDQRGQGFYRVHGGLAAIQTPPNNRGNPRGWPSRPGAGATRPMTGIDLPKIIFVRWQSLAEQQTYRVRIPIDDWVRKEMLTPHPGYCRLNDTHIQGYRNIITIGLAPGGIVKLWLIGPCIEPIEIGRFEGMINPDGPYDGMSNGEHYRLPSEHAQRYIDTHGIPFDSW
ncbi:MAG: DUF2931 family protein [Pseudomonas sp.]